MKTLIKTSLTLCVLALAGCGGGGDGEPQVAAPQTESSLITFYSTETNLPLISMTGRCQAIGETENENAVATVALLCQIKENTFEEFFINPSTENFYYITESGITKDPNDYRILLDGAELATASEDDTI